MTSRKSKRGTTKRTIEVNTEESEAVAALEKHSENAEEKEARAIEVAMGSRVSKKSFTDLRKLNKVLARALEIEQSKVSVLLDVEARSPLTYKIKPPKKRGMKPPAVSASCASDWHVEERVDPRTISFKNEHTLEIAEEKTHRFFKNVVLLYKKEAAAANIHAHIAWFGGDLSSGHIHEDLIELSQMTPMECVPWLLERIVAGLRMWRSEMDCETIIVPWNYGNHGRDGKKPRVATAAEHNFEWLLGLLVQREFKGEDGFKFLVGRGAHTYVDCNGFVIRYQHGDWANYGGGVGGLTIPLNKAINEWNKMIWADLNVMGHWHQTIDLPYLNVNGSGIGYNAYALRIKAQFEPAQQSFFLVDTERKLKTGFFPIHMTSDPGK